MVNPVKPTEDPTGGSIPLRANYSSRGWDLLNGTIQYIETHSVEQFSLAAAAEYLNTSSRMLIYHLGNRDEILGQVLALIRYRTLDKLNDPPSTSLAECVGRIIDYYLDHQWEMELFFFVSTKAFQDADAYAEFSRGSAQLWIDLITAAAEREERHDREHPRRVAAVALASLRGLLLDLFLTDDRKRVDEAFTELLTMLKKPS